MLFGSVINLVLINLKDSFLFNVDNAHSFIGLFDKFSISHIQYTYRKCMGCVARVKQIKSIIKNECK